jgi:flagellar L-ring protein precursor FlgH
MKNFASIAIAAIALSSCGKLMTDLRKDLDDSEPYTYPTSGGRWTEAGFLGADMPETGGGLGRYASVGHAERGPASVDLHGDGSQRSWVGENGARGSGEGDTTSFSSSPNLSPQTKRNYKNGSRATRADFQDNAPGEGSLWASDGQTNYYFTKNKIRGVGDIVSIKLEEEMTKDLVREVRRTLTPQERELEIAKAQDRLMRKAYGLPAEDADPREAQARAPAAAPAAGPDGKAPASKEEIKVPEATSSDIDITKAVEVKNGDALMAEIVERYPNGNYKIRGAKRVVYKNGAPRLVNFVAIAKNTDIGEDDTVASGKLYEYRLETLR